MPKRPSKHSKYGGMTEEEVAKFAKSGMSDKEIVDLGRHINKLQGRSMSSMFKRVWSLMSGKKVDTRHHKGAE